MRTLRNSLLLGSLFSFTGSFALQAQTSSGGSLPVMAPTQLTPGRSTTAPIAALGTPRDRPGARSQRAQVSCDHGMLTVHAQNSGLNGILRGIARCTGMQISGTVANQRVFGNYGPAEPATVLATLLDGTGSNMLLRETADNQPTQLILTPRTGEASPPSSFATSANEEDEDAEVLNKAPVAQPVAPSAASAQPSRGGAQTVGSAYPPAAGQAQQIAPPGQTPVPLPLSGSVVTTPASIPLPINNVNGSATNSSPTAGTYPTTDSVPIDALPTPSTTPSTSGIVDAPNPPAAGSDTAALLRGVNSNVPGTTNINPGATSTTTTPGGTNTTLPAPPTTNGTNQPGGAGTALTPEQIYQQLQQLRPAGAPNPTPPQTTTPPQ